MKYLIVEAQTNAQNQTAFLTDQKEDRNEADSVYYTKLASAAISSVPLHMVALMTYNGQLIDSMAYAHNIPEEEGAQE